MEARANCIVSHSSRKVHQPEKQFVIYRADSFSINNRTHRELWLGGSCMRVHVHEATAAAYIICNRAGYFRVPVFYTATFTVPTEVSITFG